MAGTYSVVRISGMSAPNLSSQINSLDENQLLCTKQMARLLSVSPQWLEIGRVKGYGPPYLKLTPRAIRYRLSEVREWLDKRAYQSTSQYELASQPGEGDD